ncbi:hypothetical protein AOLI_G00030080 [Acnodon oligacanthus]
MPPLNNVAVWEEGERGKCGRERERGWDSPDQPPWRSTRNENPISYTFTKKSSHWLSFGTATPPLAHPLRCLPLDVPTDSTHSIGTRF